MLAVARDEKFVLTGLVFAADGGGVALHFARMPARVLRVPTSLLTSSPNVFTVARTMTLLAAEMRTASQFASTDLTASDFRQPTRLVLERLLSA